ncbi:hypothetical protein OPV22_017683 [Ensete ventricosum]|uniref:Uncharacterized protein n=1 Tax=Ensete ventricosum TaxID=4639 RepID=A0AAV8QWX1_ENSVE|nr:hypothetical protein OPV22_017683 [Ensete ventricosum]
MFEPEAETSFSPDGDRNHSGAAAAGCDAAHRQSPSNVFDEVVAETRGELETEEFSGFGSDSDSLSMSDGYSVHELVADSDGFLSERDFDGHEHAAEDPTIHEEDLLEDKAVHISSANNPSISLSCSETQWKDAGDEDDDDESDQLWEHQDLIEQLRLELREERDIGLPTIVEESESPKTVDDLKPLTTIDKSLLLHEAAVDELHKSHKSYRERMRKLDVFNSQKMYAIGFLQLKHPLKSVKPRSSILSQSFRSIRHKLTADPTDKFIKEIHSDLEMVYVGQTCLSWEFLRWQYEKAQKLFESDTCGNHYYNQVAEEFQQFQVIIQRFIENKPFQGPMLAHFVRNRCVLRNLLQVPLIREDLEETMEDQQKVNCVVTSELIEEIMKESLRIFWEFVKTDKDATPCILRGFIGSHAELQDPPDFDLMEVVRSDLHKKEKKLREMLGTGNCIIKKFKKPKEDRSNQDLFFSQVDLKLVGRVLRMSKVKTEQLVWCHRKLSNIKFVERRIHREPSFSLFPC